MSEEKIDLGGGVQPPQANPDGLSFVTPEEAEAEVEAARLHAEAFPVLKPFPENCAYEAYECLERFRQAFALVPKGPKYLPHLARIAQGVDDNKSIILSELSRAHARGRCRSQYEIDIDEASEAEAAEVEAEKAE